MSLQLVPYFTAAVTVHALLLSVGGLLAVNSLRALAKTQNQAWEVYLDALERKRSIIDVPAKNKQIDRYKREIVVAMELDLLFGFAGITYSLYIVAFASEMSSAYPLVGGSFFFLLSQFLAFAIMALASIRYVGWWVAKAP